MAYAKVRFSHNGKTYDKGDEVKLPEEDMRDLKRLLSSSKVEAESPKQKEGIVKTETIKVTEPVKNNEKKG